MKIVIELEPRNETIPMATYMGEIMSIYGEIEALSIKNKTTIKAIHIEGTAR